MLCIFGSFGLAMYIKHYNKKSALFLQDSQDGPLYTTVSSDGLSVCSSDNYNLTDVFAWRTKTKTLIDVTNKETIDGETIESTTQKIHYDYSNWHGNEATLMVVKDILGKLPLHTKLINDTLTIEYIPCSSFHYTYFETAHQYGLSKKHYKGAMTDETFVELIKVSNAFVTLMSLVMIGLPIIGTGFWTEIIESMYRFSDHLTIDSSSTMPASTGPIGLVGNWLVMPLTILGSGLQIALGVADFMEDVVRYIVGVTIGLSIVSPIMSIFVSPKWLIGCFGAFLGWALMFGIYTRYLR